MKPRTQSTVLAVFCGLGAVASAQTPAVSEKDYLDEVPVVLSVSRLPQRLDETPGAVTLIDRQMIRMSGARDVADLLRLVPGFRVTNSFESNTPQGSYHTTLSDYSNHIQVMVDGRSVYSTYLQGSTGPGLQTVALEDIERIEVYRGSNSAAYGARAFLGSINIVTRDLADTQGVLAHVARGGNGIEDQMLRLGWGDERARFRLSADGRNDSGLTGASGSSRVQRVNLRADLRAGPQDVVELRTGQSLIDAGVGFAGDDENNVRTRRIDTSFVQLDWRRNLDADQDLAFQASHTVEHIRDAFVYTPAPSLLVDFSGQSSNSNLLLQHTVRLNPALRLVWGGELRRESIVSRPLYNTDARFNNDFARLFTNVEWRLHPDLLLNAGALMEDSSQSGSHMSPRVMLNWRLAEGHTLRGGMSRAFRPPSNYEKYANVRYFIGGVLADSTDVARGGMRSEKVLARELGYLAELPEHRLSFDLRLFDEHVTGLVGRESYDLPGSGRDNKAFDFVNDEDFRIHGHEFQLRWKPWAGGQLVYAYARVDSTQFYNATFHVGHYGTQGLMWMQQLPAGLEFGLTYSEADAGRYPGWDAAMPAVRRTDLRLAKALRVAGRPAELALVGQNLGSPYPDFRPEFRYPQRAFVQLKVEH
uniref:TonB-dependent receptor plug domain-containing protein n=1 Tax=Hylemonella sp. TaxID=2066020 RepID=UPI0035B4767C